MKGSGNWTRATEQEGEDGKINRTYLVTYANGKETAREAIKEETLEGPVDKMIRYGGIDEGTTFTG